MREQNILFEKYMFRMCVCYCLLKETFYDILPVALISKNSYRDKSEDLKKSKSASLPKFKFFCQITDVLKNAITFYKRSHNNIRDKG